MRKRYVNKPYKDTSSEQKKRLNWWTDFYSGYPYVTSFNNITGSLYLHFTDRSFDSTFKITRFGKMYLDEWQLEGELK